MLCPDCGYDNIDGVDTCDTCGQSMVQFDPSGDELEQVIARHNISVLCPKKPIVVPANVSARDAINRMVTEKIGCLLVEVDGELAGVFTERDVLNRISSDLSTLDGPVSDFMTPAPEAIKEEDSIAYALHAMDLGGYRHMAIVNGDGRPTGIISVRDILRFLCVRFAELRSENN